MKNEFERMQARLPMEMLSMKRLVLFHLSMATLMKVYFLSIYLMPLKIETYVPEMQRIVCWTFILVLHSTSIFNYEDNLLQIWTASAISW